MALLRLPDELLQIIIEEVVSDEEYYVRANPCLGETSKTRTRYEVDGRPGILAVCRRLYRVGLLAFYTNANFTFEIPRQKEGVDKAIAPLLDFLPKVKPSVLRKVELVCSFDKSHQFGNLEAALSTLAKTSQTVDLTISVEWTAYALQEYDKSRAFCAITWSVRFDWLDSIELQSLELAIPNQVPELLEPLNDWLSAFVWYDSLEPGDALEDILDFTQEESGEVRREAWRVASRYTGADRQDRADDLLRKVDLGMDQILEAWEDMDRPRRDGSY